jgi:hypothetical protein
VAARFRAVSESLAIAKATAVFKFGTRIFINRRPEAAATAVDQLFCLSDDPLGL